MNATGISSVALLILFIPCVVAPLLVLGYLFIRERRK